jgi:uncharacterized membrane protein HdeD (DUF308 family)
MEIVAALTARESNALVFGIVSLGLGIVILAYPPALRIIVALWLFVSGAAAIIWALAG